MTTTASRTGRSGRRRSSGPPPKGGCRSDRHCEPTGRTNAPDDRLREAIHLSALPRHGLLRRLRSSQLSMRQVRLSPACRLCNCTNSGHPHGPGIDGASLTLQNPDKLQCLAVRAMLAHRLLIVVQSMTTAVLSDCQSQCWPRRWDQAASRGALRAVIGTIPRKLAHPCP
jgi:hypothetical protein